MLSCQAVQGGALIIFWDQLHLQSRTDENHTHTSRPNVSNSFDVIRETMLMTAHSGHHHTPSRQISTDRQAPPLTFAETHLTPPQQPPKTHSLSSLLN